MVHRFPGQKVHVNMSKSSLPRTSPGHRLATGTAPHSRNGKHMPKPDITSGSPCWIDLMTADPQRSMDFYSELFGWTYEVGDQEKYGGYTMAFKDGQPVAGLMKNDGQSGYPDVWSTYLRVDDIGAAVDAAAANGGSGLHAADGGAGAGQDGDDRRSGRGKRRPLGIRRPHGLPARRRVRGSRMARALHPRFPGRREVLRGRVRLGHQRRGRHRRIPLLHPWRQRGSQGRNHGCQLVPPGRGTRQLARLLRRRQRG